MQCLGQVTRRSPFSSWQWRNGQRERPEQDNSQKVQEHWKSRFRFPTRFRWRLAFWRRTVHGCLSEHSHSSILSPRFKFTARQKPWEGSPRWRGWSSSTASTTLNECAATWQVSGATSSSVGYLCSHDRQAWTLLCSAHCLWLPFSLRSDCVQRETKTPPEIIPATCLFMTGSKLSTKRKSRRVNWSTWLATNHWFIMFMIFAGHLSNYVNSCIMTEKWQDL